MKQTALLFVALCSGLASLAQQSYVQSFDGPQPNSFSVTLVPSTNNTWQIGKPQKTMFNAAKSAPRVIVTDTINSYPVNDVSSFVFGIPLQNSSGNFIYALRWVQKLDLDAGLDGGIVEFSNDKVSWQNAHNNPNSYQFYGFTPASKVTLPSGDYAFSGRDTTWRDLWLCVKSTYAHQNDTLYFRFSLKSDGTQTNKEGWMIDNFRFETTILHPVKEISQLDPVVVYPNITTGMVNIEMKKLRDSDGIDEIELIDESGRVVERYGKNYTKVVLDISNHKPGLYHLRVTIHNKAQLFKLVYEKN